MFRRLLALLLATVPMSAQAAWKSVTSNHFVIYSEGSEASARETAAKLEKYLFVLKAVSSAKGEESPVKVRVYMVSDQAALGDTLPFGGGGSIAGYYSVTLRGAYAVMSRAQYRSAALRGEVSSNTGLSTQHVLFHELTHHFMHQYFPAAYPTWYSEGFADFYGATSIGAKDVVTLGLPVENRYLGFRYNQWLPVEQMISARTYADVGGSIYELYAQGWLLVHYLTTTNMRPGQLAKYLNGINAGQSFEAAAKAAFGDLGKLDSELRSHAGRGKLQTVVLPFKPIDTGPIAVRTLSPAENAMLPYVIKLQAGIPNANTGGFADAVKAVAARFPNDPYALETLADAERLAGRHADAIATADRWIAAAPENGMAVAIRAMAQMDQLAAAKSKDEAAWNAARAMLVKANKMSPDQPRILEAFYRNYSMRGMLPPASAQNALFRAYELLPQDDDLRQDVAADLEARGLFSDAIFVIKPIAVTIADPKELSPAEKAKRDAAKAKRRLAGSTDRETPREMLLRLEKKQGNGRKAEAPAKSNG